VYDMNKNFDSWLKEQKVLVCLGPGGVGKTTTAIALAFRAAALGKKIGLLSIDPARRLAQALGLTSLEPTRIPSPTHGQGFVDAQMIDPKNIFDRMVERHGHGNTKKIVNHPLYQAVSLKLAGSLEYMALAKLDEMISAGGYDLVILDTPPDNHALEFLSRPSILGGFVEYKVLPWLIKPFHHASRFGITKLFLGGEKLMGSLAKVTGLEALQLTAEFLVLMQRVIQGFYESSERMKTILRAPKTAYVLVTRPQNIPILTAQELAKELLKKGFSLDVILFNRCLPKGLVKNIKKSGEKALVDLGYGSLWDRKKSERTLQKELLEVLWTLGSTPFALGIPEDLQGIQTPSSLWEMASQFEPVVLT
jgi:anion-transporting  ArsA/GET3 family ATPase